MAAAQRGDAVAYESLLRELRPSLQGFIRRQISNDAAVEDIVQTVLLSLHRARHSYRSEHLFEPWLWAIARNALTDFQRKRSRRNGREEPLPDENALPDGFLAPSSSDTRAGRDQVALSRDLEHALSRLPASQQEAVLLLHLEGLSVIEAAVRAHVSPGALKARVHRAYRALRTLLEEEVPS
ncbi:MAG TPA: RNA polymerase subunit sigma [Deltaproteobacteria bacterium]|jgi:RNA polymerase sigma-70 factor (ECF subfamily)|nr:RNA polymerase subunit sigma [Deltaproteobacteria bacterium]